MRGVDLETTGPRPSETSRMCGGLYDTSRRVQSAAAAVTAAQLSLCSVDSAAGGVATRWPAVRIRSAQCRPLTVARYIWSHVGGSVCAVIFRFGVHDIFEIFTVLSLLATFACNSRN